MPKKLTKEEFIKKAIKIHNNKYDYSLVEYKNNRTKVKIICPIHSTFEQSPSSHLMGLGCDECGGTFKLTTEKFIEKAKVVHNNVYDYSLVNYINNSTNIKIVCKKHGEFEQSPSSHINHNAGCPMCANIIKGQSVKLNTEIFIEKAKEIHNDKYDYSLVDYIGTINNIKIICKKHGIFEQIPNSHLNGRGCPICNESKGEKEIKKYLINNNIKFIRQKTFDKCKYKQKLQFDFYLPNYNICIEYNGIQHYEPIDFFGGIENFNINNERFLIKEKYCHQQNIKLIVIKYTDNIEYILTSLLGHNK